MGASGSASGGALKTSAATVASHASDCATTAKEHTASKATNAAAATATAARDPPPAGRSRPLRSSACTTREETRHGVVRRASFASEASREASGAMSVVRGRCDWSAVSCRRPSPPPRCRDERGRPGVPPDERRRADAAWRDGTGDASNIGGQFILEPVPGVAGSSGFWSGSNPAFSSSGFSDETDGDPTLLRLPPPFVDEAGDGDASSRRLRSRSGCCRDAGEPATVAAAAAHAAAPRRSAPPPGLPCGESIAGDGGDKSKPLVTSISLPSSSAAASASSLTSSSSVAGVVSSSLSSSSSSSAASAWMTRPS